MIPPDPRGLLRDLVLTATITYADRLLAFTVPLYLLSAPHSSNQYTAVEYIISLSVLLSTFCDLGVRNFVLYHNRQIANRTTTTELTLAAYCIILTCQLTLIAAWLFISHGSASFGRPEWNEPLITAALLRTSGLGISAVLFQFSILHERPALASVPSLIQWLIALAAMVYWPPNAGLPVSAAIAVPSVPLILIGTFYTVRALRVIGITRSIEHVVSATRWGWPLLVSAALSVGISTISRIYGFNHLPQSDQLTFQFWFRILYIVQLAHAASMTSMTSAIYTISRRGIDVRILYAYSRIIALSALLVLGFFVLQKALPSIAPRVELPVLCTLTIYILAWCFGAHIELYLTRDNHNRSILIVAGTSAAVYFLLLTIFTPQSAQALASVMAISSLLQVTLLIHKSVKTANCLGS